MFSRRDRAAALPPRLARSELSYRYVRFVCASMHAHPLFGSSDDSRLASPHFKFAVAPMRQGLLCGSLTRLWIVNRPAFPFGLASLEVLQHHQPLQPPPAQSPIGAIPVAKAGIRPQGSGIHDLSA